MRRLLLGVLASASLLSACDEGCSDELKIAIELYLTVPDGVSVDKVTAELDEEQECTSFRPDKEQPEQVYTCYEQGAGSYKVRVYSAGKEIHSEDVEVRPYECHAERVSSFITVEPPTE